MSFSNYFSPAAPLWLNPYVAAGAIYGLHSGNMSQWTHVPLHPSTTHGNGLPPPAHAQRGVVSGRDLVNNGNVRQCCHFRCYIQLYSTSRCGQDVVHSSAARDWAHIFTICQASVAWILPLAGGFVYQDNNGSQVEPWRQCNRNP